MSYTICKYLQKCLMTELNLQWILSETFISQCGATLYPIYHSSVLNGTQELDACGKFADANATEMQIETATTFKGK